MKITLLGHSGFLVEGETATLVFDFYTDEQHLLPGVPFGKRPVLFFASHRHGDHYNRTILGHAGPDVTYVLDSGIELPKGVSAVRLAKGQQAEVAGVTIRAYGSTDEGISFLCGFEGGTVFHAGDLNDWYWEEESTAEELRHDEQWFLDEIAPLEGFRPDVAFFPVDRRLGRHALRGPMKFARSVQPRVLIPMHLSGGVELPGELQKALLAEHLPTKVANLTEPGDSIEISN